MTSDDLLETNISVPVAACHTTELRSTLMTALKHQVCLKVVSAAAHPIAELKIDSSCCKKIPTMLYLILLIQFCVNTKGVESQQSLPAHPCEEEFRTELSSPNYWHTCSSSGKHSNLILNWQDSILKRLIKQLLPNMIQSQLKPNFIEAFWCKIL